PDVRVTIRQKIERLGLRQLLAAERKPQIGNGFVKKPHPRATTRDGFFVQQLFQLVVQLMRAKGANITKPRPVMSEDRISELVLQISLFEPVDLQCEKQQSG